MFCVGVDLNVKLEKGLKPAFQYTNHMFNMDADLSELIDRCLQGHVKLTFDKW